MQAMIDSKLALHVEHWADSPSAPWIMLGGRGIPSGRYDTELEAASALVEAAPARIQFAHAEILRLASRRRGIAPAMDERLIAEYANGILHLRVVASAYAALVEDLRELRKAEELEDKPRAAFYRAEAYKSRARAALLVEDA